MANKIKGSTFLVWSDWFESIEEMRDYCVKSLEYFPIAFCIHDRDKYLQDDVKLGHKKGDPVKIHAHFCIMGKPNKKESIILERLLHCPEHLYFQKVHRGEEMYEYLTHGDFSSQRKGKVLYSEEELYKSELFCEEDFRAIKEDLFSDMAYQAISDNGFTEVFQLVDYARASEDHDFFEYVQGSLLKFKGYLDSRRYYMSSKNREFIKKDTERQEINTEFDLECFTAADYIEIKRYLEDQKEKSVFDSRGVRWLKCSKCGCIATVDSFAIYGGKDHTHGICHMCKDTPEIPEKKKELCSEKELKDIDKDALKKVQEFLGEKPER